MSTLAVDLDHVADVLLNSPVRLSNLPRHEHGLYALYDHEGIIRYVGETAASGYFHRVHNNHVTGSEEGHGPNGRSHMFAFHYINNEASCGIKLTRQQAAVFVRLKCGAAIFPVPGRPLGVYRRHDPPLKTYRAVLEALEKKVITTIRARGFGLNWKA